MIQEIKEYNSDICYEIGKRIQDMRNKRKIKAVELACYLNIGKKSNVSYRKWKSKLYSSTIILYSSIIELLC